ncbi:MAG: hypothetical protein Q8J62_07685 [Candidatus Cloacimonadaceae bacterium]|nr:hypothetical protein [Candidatus Cloacimonadaceae bacterium]
MKHKPVLRGGSWNNNDNNCRVANRNNNNPDNRNNNNGFRVFNAMMMQYHRPPELINEKIFQVSKMDSPVSYPGAMASNDYIQVSRASQLRKPDILLFDKTQCIIYFRTTQPLGRTK